MLTNDTICPLRGKPCSNECEWASDAGLCIAHHIAVNMERIAEALKCPVSDLFPEEGGNTHE